MKQVQHTHGIHLLSNFSYPNNGDQDKWSQETDYQLAKFSPRFPDLGISVLT